MLICFWQIFQIEPFNFKVKSYFTDTDVNEPDKNHDKNDFLCYCC